jgi:AraC-like DNA-binding protein
MSSSVNSVLSPGAAQQLDRESAHVRSGVRVCKNPSNGEMTAAIIRLTDAFCEIHEHPEAQVSLLIRGSSAELLTRGTASAATHTAFRPGTTVYIAPGQPHRVQWHGNAEMLSFYFPDTFGEEITEQTKRELPRGSILYSADAGVREIGQLIRDELSWNDGFSTSMIDHARFLMAARLIRLFDFKSTRPMVGLLDVKRLQPAIDALIELPERHFSLAELARLCNSSVFHFARSFTARLGSPPYAYQRTLRLQKAQTLLRDTDLPIEAVAYAIGVERSTNFSRMFRHYTGCSPKEFRRLVGTSLVASTPRS